MKKLLSLTLASAMVMSMATNATASNEADYPVGAISDMSYVFDKDISAIDLADPTHDFSYGETIYYPLLNTTADSIDETISTARAEVVTAQDEKTTANEALVNAQTTAKEKADAVIAATLLVANMQEVLDAANAWQTALPFGDAIAIGTAKTAYEAVAKKYGVVIQLDAATAVKEATTKHDSAKSSLTTATDEKTTADANIVTAEETVVTAVAKVTEKQSALDTLLATATPYVDESDAVNGIKIRDDWEQNGKLVEDVEIVKKRITGGYLPTEKFIYFLAIELATSAKTNEADIHGVVELRKSGSNGFDDVRLDITIEVEFPEAYDNTITAKARMFSISNGFEGDTEDELYFEVDEDSYFTVNTTGQGNLILSMNSDYNRSISNDYPKANLDFLNGNGASFNKIGVMSISADRDSYIYELEDDGELTLIDTKYDKDDEVHTFKTRHLDSYVISDIELIDDEDEEDDDVENKEDKDKVEVDNSNSGNSNTNSHFNPNTGAVA